MKNIEKDCLLQRYREDVEGSIIWKERGPLGNPESIWGVRDSDRDRQSVMDQSPVSGLGSTREVTWCLHSPVVVHIICAVAARGYPVVNSSERSMIIEAMTLRGFSEGSCRRGSHRKLEIITFAPSFLTSIGVDAVLIIWANANKPAKNRVMILVSMPLAMAVPNEKTAASTVSRLLACGQIFRSNGPKVPEQYTQSEQRHFCSNMEQFGDWIDCRGVYAARPCTSHLVVLQVKKNRIRNTVRVGRRGWWKSMKDEGFF